MSDKLFNILRSLAEVILPALGTLYLALAQILELPYGEKVTGTIVAVAAFLGTLVTHQRRAYNKSGAGLDGTLVVDQTSLLKDVYSLDLSTPLDEVAKQSKMTLEVKNVSLDQVDDDVEK